MSEAETPRFRVSRGICKELPAARLVEEGVFNGEGTHAVEVVDPLAPLVLKFAMVQSAAVDGSGAKLKIDAQQVQARPLVRGVGRWRFECPSCGRACKTLFSPMDYAWRCQKCWKIPPPSQERGMSRIASVPRKPR